MKKAFIIGAICAGFIATNLTVLGIADHLMVASQPQVSTETQTITRLYVDYHTLTSALPSDEDALKSCQIVAGNAPQTDCTMYAQAVSKDIAGIAADARQYNAEVAAHPLARPSALEPRLPEVVQP